MSEKTSWCDKGLIVLLTLSIWLNYRLFVDFREYVRLNPSTVQVIDDGADNSTQEKNSR